MAFIPPPSPALSAEEIAQFYIDSKLSIRFGTLIECICFSFYVTWSSSIVFFMRKMERGMPILSYTSIATNGGGYVHDPPPQRHPGRHRRRPRQCRQPLQLTLTRTQAAPYRPPVNLFQQRG